jgi:two-component system response regulator PilR (NtrC family)
VADLPLLMQVKLLRAIQEKRVRKVGSTAEEAVDVRIISATHHHYSRTASMPAPFARISTTDVNVIELKMPPLRERPEDIAPWSRRCCCGSVAPQPPRLDPGRARWQALKDYSFPGNVRELENILERATALCNNAYSGAVDDLQLAPEMAVGDSSARGRNPGRLHQSCREAGHS